MKELKVAFIHPDLGIGGAERLVVDAAIGLQNLKHKVSMFTAHHEKTRCFKETKDGTIDVTVYGDFIPTSFFGYFHILFAILRMIYCAIMVSLFYKFDIIIIDQVR
jgi:alpha-1,3/alpha-1,6-mannosyltransferase